MTGGTVRREGSAVSLCLFVTLWVEVLNKSKVMMIVAESDDRKSEKDIPRGSVVEYWCVCRRGWIPDIKTSRELLK